MQTIAATQLVLAASDSHRQTTLKQDGRERMVVRDETMSRRDTRQADKGREESLIHYHDRNQIENQEA